MKKLLFIILALAAGAGTVTLSDGRIWRGDKLIDGSGDLVADRVKAPEKVSWARMHSLAAKVDEASRSNYFHFFEKDTTFGIDNITDNAFYVVNGQITVKSDVNQIQGILIAVTTGSNHPALIKFENNDGAGPLTINGILYSAGTIDFGGRQVQINYNPSLIFSSDLKEVFTDWTNWQQGM